MPAIPPTGDFNKSTIDKDTFHAKFLAVHAYLTGLLGSDGLPSTALSSLGVSAFIKTLLDDADAVTARATIGALASLRPTVTKQGVEGGEIALEIGTGSTLAGNVLIDSATNSIRFFEGGGTARGAYIDLASAPASASGLIWHSGNAYACRAWVNFNGTGAVAINASGNVSSITDVGVGIYTVNFTTALGDANYSAIGSVRRNSTVDSNLDFTLGYDGYQYTAGGFSINVRNSTALTLEDPLKVCIAVFR